MASIFEVLKDSVLVKTTYSYGCLGDVTVDGCASIHGDITKGDTETNP
jgi:hypothetical protein